MKKKQIINNDCLIALKELDDNSVDSIVTDPPYGLSFMGKKWDYDVPSQEIWEECLRVLKPGGYLLAFAGTRTQHRMAVRIEDAGFEIRDMIAWIYGCLSEDTEILTEKGFRLLRKTKPNDRIAIYDIETNTYKWEKPKAWQMYNIKQDTAYRIQSDYTDQIVSRNHRCLVEREGKLVFIQAEELAGMETMPYLPNDFYNLQEICWELLFTGLLWKSKRLAKKLFSKWTRQEMSKQGYERGEKSSVEGWTNLPKEKGKVCRPIYKICEMSKRLFIYGKKRWVCYGTQNKCCDGNKKTINESRERASHQSRCDRQQNRELNAIRNECRTQKIRVGSGYKTTLATITPIKYTGMIFCPTVSTGAFIARRNGKIFITGNSGFPKSLNIGKAVDKIQGNEREITKIRTDGNKGGGANTYDDDNYVWDKPFEETKGTSEWEGWGTALKPALEPITVARKPIEGNVAQNCLKWKVGGINIDGCRVGTDGGTSKEVDKNIKSTMNSMGGGQFYNGGINNENYGRFPANLIHDGSDEVVGLFPVTKGPWGKKKSTAHTAMFNAPMERELDNSQWQSDGESAARFFYCAKASKSERNKGCEGLEEKEATKFDGGDFKRGNDNNAKEQTHKNNHPTVKPIALMEYLVKLVSKEGHTVLDPFMGSGSTGIACKKLGREFIGIELDADYCKIAEARINGYKVSEQETLL